MAGLMPEFFAFLGLAALLYFFYDSLRCKELASRHGRRHCQKLDLQFLDETVAQRKLGFTRNANGRLGFVRFYSFEFCSDGSHRYRGSLEVRGPWVGNIQLEPYIDKRVSAEDRSSAIDGSDTPSTKILEQRNNTDEPNNTPD